MTLKLRTSNLWYLKYTPDASLDYKIESTNNLAMNLYSQQIYKQKSLFNKIVLSVSAFAMLIFFLRLGSCRIVTIQMMAVNQLAFLGLFILNQSDPLIHSLNIFGVFNFMLNLFPRNQQKTPNIIFAVGFSSSVISNINASLIIVFLPLIISALCYFIHGVSIKYRIRMEKATKLLIGQWTLTAFIVILYNYSISFIAFFFFTSQTKLHFYISLFQLVILTAIFAILLWMYITKKVIWMGEYKSLFNWNKFGELCYLIPIFQRFIVGILFTALNISYASSIIFIFIFAFCIAAVAYKKPFVQKSQNIRSIICNSYSIIILILYTILSARGQSAGQSNFTYLPYAILYPLQQVLDTLFIGLLKTIKHENMIKIVQNLNNNKPDLNTNSKKCKTNKEKKQEISIPNNQFSIDSIIAEIQTMSITSNKTKQINNQSTNNNSNSNDNQQQIIKQKPTIVEQIVQPVIFPQNNNNNPQFQNPLNLNTQITNALNLQSLIPSRQPVKQQYIPSDYQNRINKQQLNNNIADHFLSQMGKNRMLTRQPYQNDKFFVSSKLYRNASDKTFNGMKRRGSIDDVSKIHKYSDAVKYKQMKKSMSRFGRY